MHIQQAFSTNNTSKIKIKQNMKKICITLILLVAFMLNLSASDVLKALNFIPEISNIKKIETKDFLETYTFTFEQPIKSIHDSKTKLNALNFILSSLWQNISICPI